MNGKTFIITYLRRLLSHGASETLAFKPGVNLIVGEKDAGKTKWLSMLDYLLGDTGSAEDAFGTELADKYDSVAAGLALSDGSEITVERRWKVQGAKGKLFVNDSPMDADEFGDFLLERLDIPRIRFPKGNPWNDRTWPKLSWRTLFRSIYRQERFWSEFVDRQPEGDQAAALLQFLGVADKQFPQSYEELIQKRKLLQKLEGQRDAYAAILHSVTAELLQQGEITVAVTGESIERTKDRINKELASLTEERGKVLQEIRESRKIEDRSLFEFLRAQKAAVDKQHQEVLAEVEIRRKRMSELRAYKQSVEAEISRLKRTRTAGSHLIDFKVSHCPACEQPVHEPEEATDVCYLCGRPQTPEGSSLSSSARIDFELDQLQEEFGEFTELIGKSEEDLGNKDSTLRELRNDLRKIEIDLAPAIRSATEALPPDLSIIDVKLGRFYEQLEQIRRVQENLATQSELTRRIQEIQMEVESLDAEQRLNSEQVDFRASSQILEDGMNSYLNALNESSPARWTKGKISVKLTEKAFYVSIREADLAAQVGATSKAIVIFSYHYALLKLSADATRNYPGLVIIDFPLTLGEGERLADAENYLVEPFSRLCSALNMRHTQFIAAGRAFEHLDDANQIKLTGIY
jgi:hypothetical protein